MLILRWLRPWQHVEEQHFAQAPDMVRQPRCHRWCTGLPQLACARAIGCYRLQQRLTQGGMGQAEIVVRVVQGQVLAQAVRALAERYR